MPLTKKVSQFTVTYEDGTSQTFHRDDWEVYGMQGQSDIVKDKGQSKKVFQYNTFSASRRVTV